jgi:hypothetical protein
MCFNNSTFASRASIPLVSQSEAEKALYLSVQKDLPLNSEELHFDIVNAKPNYILQRGVPLVFLTNFVAKRGELKWNRQQPLFATFNLYDPTAEAGHRKVFWSARQDGVYHSSDNVNWNKITGWSS